VSAVHAQAPSAGVVEPVRPEQTLPEVNEQPLYKIPATPQRDAQDSNQTLQIPVKEFVISVDRPEYLSAEQLQLLQVTLNAYLEAKNYQLTFAEIESAANLATRHLRDQNFMLALAAVPPQEVEAAVIHLRVFLGILESAQAKLNQRYKSNAIERVFKNSLDKPLETLSTESTLLRINDMPGMRAIARFKPGKAMGTTAMAVEVQQEKPIDGYARADNYGLESTGDIRLLGGLAVNNITGHLDRLMIDAIKTFDPGDLRNARMAYEITDPSLYHTAGFSYSETRYDVDGSNTAIDGDTEIASLFLKSRWIRQQNYSLSSRVSLTTKRAEQNILGNSEGVDRLTVLSASLISDVVDTRFRGLQRAVISWHQGFDNFVGSMNDFGNRNSLTKFNNKQELSGDFEKISAAFTRLQALNNNHALLLSLSGQYTDDALSSLEKMGLGGPYAVRAYPLGELISDSAGLASIAWEISGGAFSNGIAYGENTWADILSVSIFFDWAEGKLLQGNGETRKEAIHGAGIGLNVAFPEVGAYLDFAVAEPTSSYRDASGHKQRQYWIAAGVRF